MARGPSMVALILVTGTTALSTDTYIAALPALRADLDASASGAQLTLTACIAGLALGQVLIGPVSDSRGRRRVVLVATVVFAIASALCAIATTDAELIAVRAIEGAAAGAAGAVGRAVVTDSFEGRAAAARFGTLTAVSLIAPVVGPVIGGVLLSVASWRAIFVFLALVGVAMTVGTWFGLPETLPQHRRHPGGLRHLRDRGVALLRDPAFRAPVLVQCCTTAGFFVYIGGSSLVLQEGEGLSSAAYTALFSVNAIAMIASSVTYRLLVLRLGPEVLRRAAQILQTAAVLALAAVALVSLPHRPPLLPVWGCLAAMTAGLGTYLPSNSSIAQAAGRRFAGTASALAGGLPFLAGALTTPLTGLLHAETVPAMAGAMAVFFAAAAVVAVLVRRRPAAA